MFFYIVPKMHLSLRGYACGVPARACQFFSGLDLRPLCFLFFLVAIVYNWKSACLAARSLNLRVVCQVRATQRPQQMRLVLKNINRATQVLVSVARGLVVYLHLYVCQAEVYVVVVLVLSTLKKFIFSIRTRHTRIRFFCILYLCVAFAGVVRHLFFLGVFWSAFSALSIRNVSPTGSKLGPFSGHEIWAISGVHIRICIRAKELEGPFSGPRFCCQWLGLPVLGGGSWVIGEVITQDAAVLHLYSQVMLGTRSCLASSASRHELHSLTSFSLPWLFFCYISASRMFPSGWLSPTDCLAQSGFK